MATVFHYYEEILSPDVKPLYLYDTTWARSNQPLQKMDPHANDLEINRIQEVILTLAPNYADGVIVFRASDLNEMFQLYRLLKDTNYCALFDIASHQIFEADINGVNRGLVLVNVDSESG